MTQKAKLLDAALVHVPFDGWSDATLTAAANDCAINMNDAKALFPRGAIDLALAYHKSGDAQMREKLLEHDLSALRIRDKISLAIRLRLEAADKELVRKGTAYFSLPQHMAHGTAAVWGSSDLIWKTLQDPSTDINWYSKRATLFAVYSSVLLYWLGDSSKGDTDTWAFLDRRIDDVMWIEKVKAKSRGSALHSLFMKGPGKFLDQIKAPTSTAKAGYPGYWSDKNSSAKSET